MKHMKTIIIGEIMTTEITKHKKFYESLRKTLRHLRNLKKATKISEIIFMNVLNAHEETTKLLLALLKVREKSRKVYGK